MADYYWPTDSVLNKSHPSDSFAVEKEKNNGPEGGMISEGLSSKIQAKRGGGSPLSSGMLKEYQAQFKRNLKDVRIHQDAEADAMNESLNAGAFTIGSDIFLSSDVKPETGGKDREILTHEMAHVVQQGGKAPRGRLNLGAVNASEEHQASSAGNGMSHSVSVGHSSQVGTVRRWPEFLKRLFGKKKRQAAAPSAPVPQQAPAGIDPGWEHIDFGARDYEGLDQMNLENENRLKNAGWDFLPMPSPLALQLEFGGAAKPQKKKQGFFSRLFGKKSTDEDAQRENRKRIIDERRNRVLGAAYADNSHQLEVDQDDDRSSILSFNAFNDEYNAAQAANKNSLIGKGWEFMDVTDEDKRAAAKDSLEKNGWEFMNAAEEDKRAASNLQQEQRADINKRWEHIDFGVRDYEGLDQMNLENENRLKNAGWDFLPMPSPLALQLEFGGAAKPQKKKQGFFSRLFGKKSTDEDAQRENRKRIIGERRNRILGAAYAGNDGHQLEVEQNDDRSSVLSYSFEDDLLA